MGFYFSGGWDVNNCWGWAIRRMLEEKREPVLLVRPTRKSRGSWYAPRWAEVVVVWSLLTPSLVALNIAFWLLRGRWLHVALGREGEWEFSHYVPPDEEYQQRWFPPLVFHGVVRRFRFPEGAGYNDTQLSEEV